MKRLDSIDVMRALAIIFMVLCHFTVFWSPANGGYPWVYLFGNHMVGDLAAPLFLFLVGYSQVISWKKGRKSESIWQDKAVRRGIFIILFGLAFSMSMRGPSSIFEWDVLPLIGVAVLAVRLARPLSPWALFAVAIFLVMIAPPLRAHTDFLSSWGGSLDNVPGLGSLLPGLLRDPARDYAASFQVQQVVEGFLLEGYFPVAPWLAFAFAGFGLGKLSFGKDVERDSRAATAAGLLLVLGSLVLGTNGLWDPGDDPITEHLSGFTFYPLSVSLFGLQLGVCLLLYGATRFIYDREGGGPRFGIGYLRQLSRYSLTLYVLHHAVIYWPLYALAALTGDTESYSGHPMNAPMALLASVVFLAMMGPIMTAWDKVGGKYSFEWLLREATKPRRKLIPSEEAKVQPEAAEWGGPSPPA